MKDRCIKRARILITGSTGFVGRQILRQLRQEDVSLRLIVRPESQHKIFLPNKESDEIVLTNDLFTETKDWWNTACKNVDTIIHAAWYAVPGKYLASTKNLDCLIRILQMAQAATRANVRRFVSIGTCAEYALSDQPLSIDAPLNPTTAYAATKAAAYLALLHFLDQAKMEFAWCRLFYLYGENEDPRRLVATIRNALANGQPALLTSGHQIRDFMDVQEAGRQIAKVALGSETGAFNICSGKAISVREFANTIAAEYHREDLLKFGARADNPFDPPFVVGVPSCS